MRRVLVALSGLAVIALINLLAAEIVLRFLPVDSGRRTAPVNAAQPVYRFTPDRPFVYSRDWDFRLVNRGRVNNDGFVNDQDYRADETTPLLALIGDSYVEALMVPFAQSLAGRLSDAARDRARVYSFAASGAPLSQYLVWADYARRTYRPRGLVVLVIGNDFDESLLAYKTAPGFHYFTPGSDGALVLRRVDYAPSAVRRLLTQSALVRYFYLNLQGPWRLEQFAMTAWQRLRGETTIKTYVANTDASADAARVTASKAAVNAALAALPAASGLPPDRILFVVNAIQDPRHLTAPNVDNSFFIVMRRYLIETAVALGFEVADLAPVFATHYAAGGALVDFTPWDDHWNTIGHRLAAEVVVTSKVFRSVVGPATQSPAKSSR